METVDDHLEPSFILGPETSRPRKIAVVGGTHGNERGGVWVVEDLLGRPQDWQVPGLEVIGLLANPLAIQRNLRYLDRDLNRCFGPQLLHSRPDHEVWERRRALEIFEILGGGADRPDLVIDLHNTTANMGVTLIVSRLNPFITRLVATLQQRYPSFVHILYTPEEQMSSTFLDSLGVSGLTVETGPLEHGPHLDVVQYDKVRKIASDIMDFCAAWNTDSAPKEKAEVPVYRFLREVQYEDFDKDAVMEEDLNPELLGKDFQPIAPGTLLLSRGVGVPEYWAGPGLAYPCFIRERAYRSVSEDEVALYLTSLSTENW